MRVHLRVLLREGLLLCVSLGVVRVSMKGKEEGGEPPIDNHDTTHTTVASPWRGSVGTWARTPARGAPPPRRLRVSPVCVRGIQRSAFSVQRRGGGVRVRQCPPRRPLTAVAASSCSSSISTTAATSSSPPTLPAPCFCRCCCCCSSRDAAAVATSSPPPAMLLLGRWWWELMMARWDGLHRDLETASAYFYMCLCCVAVGWDRFACERRPRAAGQRSRSFCRLSSPFSSLPPPLLARPRTEPKSGERMHAKRTTHVETESLFALLLGGLPLCR